MNSGRDKAPVNFFVVLKHDPAGNVRREGGAGRSAREGADAAARGERAPPGKRRHGRPSLLCKLLARPLSEMSIDF